LAEQLGDVGYDVGVEPKLGLFDRDQGRRLGMQEDGQQAEVPQRAVREPAGEDLAPPFFGGVELNTAARGLEGIILDALVEAAERVEHPSLDLRTEVQEDQREILASVAQKIASPLHGLSSAQQRGRPERPIAERMDLVILLLKPGEVWIAAGIS